jgi:hypothetical protein
MKMLKGFIFMMLIFVLKNRQQFAIKYQEILPIKAKKIFGKNNKLKVLIGCLNFNNYTGSELYVYELAKELVKNGCEVDIISNIGDKLVNKVKKFGVNCYSLNEPKGFKLGDGKWALNTNKGSETSVVNKLYKINDPKYDIININHKPIGEYLLNLYPNATFINTVHSEVIPNLEEPVIDSRVKKYITIRESISDYIINGWNIPKEMVTTIYNPIDYERFKPYNCKVKSSILFVGTIDYLRKNTIYDLVEHSQKNGKELWLVGDNKSDYLDDLIKYNHIKYHQSNWNIEEFVKECEETASVMMGRTTIEGWLCGKPGWIYTITNTGDILNKELKQVPSDVEKYKSKIVAQQILNEYKNII